MTTTATPPAPPELSSALPELDPATNNALRASIEQFGVLVPVVVDQNGRTLDGRNRLRIADDLGVECPRHEIHVAEDADVSRLLMEINDARRQRLTTEQRKAVVVALREQGHSIRAIAEATGEAKNTVADDVKATVRSGQLKKPPATVKGKDGKTRKAVRKATADHGLGTFTPKEGDTYEPSPVQKLTIAELETMSGQRPEVAKLPREGQTEPATTRWARAPGPR